MCSTDGDSVALGITFLAVCFSPHKTASTTSGSPDTSCSVEGEESFRHTHTHTNQISIIQAYISRSYVNILVHISTCSATHLCTHTLFWQRWPKCEMSCKGWVGVRKSVGPMMPQLCHPTSWCYVAPQTEIASVTCVLVPEILACCLWWYK